MQLYEQKAGIGHVSVASLHLALGGDKRVLGARRPRRLPARRSAAAAPEQRRASSPARRPPGRHGVRPRRTGGHGYLAVAQVGHARQRPRRRARRREAGLRAPQPLAAAALASSRSRSGSGSPSPASLVVYFSRRIAGPLEELAAAADEVAAGHYDVALPERTWGSEVERLATRFDEMTARLAESEQLSRNFLMSVSHELRTPLTAIRGHVAALREGVFEDEAAQQLSLEVVSEEALRLERLVGDVLDLAKLDARRFALLREEVDMRALCERAYATFAEEAKARGIEYDLALGGGRGADHRRRPRAADRHEPDRERAPLDAGGRARRPRRSRRTNGEVTVAVADTGPGIAPEEQERIFRPFWSGRRRRDGARARRSRASSRSRSAAGSSSQRARPRQPLRARPAGEVVAQPACLTLVEAVDDARRRASVPPRAWRAAPRRSASRRR